MKEDQEDVEEMERHIYERYAKSNHVEYGEEATEVEQQALLPSVKDPKLWMVKCATGKEHETAICLMQKFIDKPGLQIRSAVALDHIENYICVEADKEAHVKEACEGLKTIIKSAEVRMVPINQMTDTLSVEGKLGDLAIDTWVRMKRGVYSGDLAKVVHVNNVNQTVTVKLIPRIDLQNLADKKKGINVGENETTVPPPRFFNKHEASQMQINVVNKKPKGSREYFDIMNGMMFKDGFLYKTVSKKSISSQGTQPSLDELEKFRKPGDDADGDMASLSTLFANRKKGHFLKGDAVVVVRGDLKNLMGWVEKVEEENVHIKHKMAGLPKTLAFNEKELCKYFKPGDHVKVVSGVQEGATGMVVKVEEHVLIILSDTTKEDIRISADYVVLNNVVTSGGSSNKTSNSLRPSPFCQSPSRRSRGSPSDSGGRFNRGGRGQDELTGRNIKIHSGPFKGYRGRVKEVTGLLVRVELDSQMKIVTVKKDHIEDTAESTTPFREPSRYGMGSETPMHPSRTPLHPYPTPVRDPGATPIHDGMRTPMVNPAWAPMSPPRDNWEDGNPRPWGTSPQYQPGMPGTSTARPCEAPTPGWVNSPGGNYSDSRTPRENSPPYANAPSLYLPSTPGLQPMTPSSASYLSGTPGSPPMIPGNKDRPSRAFLDDGNVGLNIMSPTIAGRRHSMDGRRQDALTRTDITTRSGHYKGYRGRVTDPSVKVELESLTKTVTVKKDQIGDVVGSATSLTKPRYGMGSKTPLHTPVHPYQTPMRNPAAATPIHGGMRTPVDSWPSRDYGEDGNPGSRLSRVTSPQYQPGTPTARPYEVPTPGSANDQPSAPGLQPVTPKSASYLPGAPGGQPMTPGKFKLDIVSPIIDVPSHHDALAPKEPDKD